MRTIQRMGVRLDVERVDGVGHLRLYGMYMAGRGSLSRPLPRTSPTMPMIWRGCLGGELAA